MMRQRRGARQPGLPLMLLLMQMFNVGFDRIPPVTLATIAGQVIIFLRLVNLPWPHISEVCISPIQVWYREEWQRLVLASFFHLSDWHLYYNMVSFLWKGISLERKLGSKYFAYMIAIFSVLTSAVTVALGILADNIMKDSSYLSQCAAGFSGVLFALKVITTHLLPPGVQYIMGFIPVPSRIACWVELAVIQVLVPNASFLGHLAGILVGLLYVKGPLKYIMDFAFPAPPSYTYAHGATGTTSSWFGGNRRQPAQQPRPRQENQYNNRAGNTGYQNSHQYHGGLSEEEQMQQAMRESMQDYERTSRGVPPTAPPAAHPTAPPGGYPTEPPPAYDTLDHSAIPPPHSRQTAPYPTVSSNFRRENPYQAEGPPYPTDNAYATGSGSRLYPDLSRNADSEEMRRRRLARFDSR